MDIAKLLQIATATQLAADEAFDAAVHIAMVEAIKEISARYPRRRFRLTAGMGSCTIDVTGKVCGRDAVYTLYWDESDGCLRYNSGYFVDKRPGAPNIGYSKIMIESALIKMITDTQAEVYRDPISYCDEFVCVGGKVVPEPVGSSNNLVECV